MATDGPTPIQGVLSALSQGVSARAGLQAFREAGGEVRDATWYRLHGEVQASFSAELTEAGRPQNRAPGVDELTTWSTVNAAGYLQQVEVALRDRGTGEVYFKPFSIAGDGLLTRQAAVAKAIETYSEGADAYDEQVLGAVHVGAYELVPSE